MFDCKLSPRKPYFKLSKYLGPLSWVFYILDWLGTSLSYTVPFRIFSMCRRSIGFICSVSNEGFMNCPFWKLTGYSPCQGGFFPCPFPNSGSLWVHPGGDFIKSWGETPWHLKCRCTAQKLHITSRNLKLPEKPCKAPQRRTRASPLLVAGLALSLLLRSARGVSRAAGGIRGENFHGHFFCIMEI